MFGFDLTQAATATMVLFAVVDIVGSIPLILEIKRNVGKIEPEKASVVALLIMIFFLFLGESILKIIGIDVGSFAIAGSFILFFMALEMILGIKLYKDEKPETASVVPLAFPIIAGTGTMTSLLSLRAEYESINIILAIIINMIVVYIVLKLSDKIEKILGKTGIAIVRKVFGIILLAIAVKLFRTNAGI
jgi:multiple antibiotic resistance protein